MGDITSYIICTNLKTLYLNMITDKNKILPCILRNESNIESLHMNNARYIIETQGMADDRSKL